MYMCIGAQPAALAPGPAVPRTIRGRGAHPTGALRVWSLGLRVVTQGLAFWVLGSGFLVLGSGWRCDPRLFPLGPQCLGPCAVAALIHLVSASTWEFVHLGICTV